MPPPTERTINLYGPPEAVEYAKQLIMEKVAGAVSRIVVVEVISLFFSLSLPPLVPVPLDIGCGFRSPV